MIFTGCINVFYDKKANAKAKTQRFHVLNAPLKKFFLLLIFCVSLSSINTSHGQTYGKFVDTSKLWNTVDIYNWLVSGGQPNYEYTKVAGDTIIGLYSYKKVWISYDTNHTTWYHNGFMREDSLSKVYYMNYVYYYQNNDSILTEGLIYDFGLNVNDSVQISNIWACPDTIWVKAVQVDSIFIYDIYHKRIIINHWDAYEQENEYWIEGIGSSFGLMYSARCFVGGMPYLLCYFENDTLKYQNPNYSNCNISSDVEIINNDFTINVIIYPNPLNKNLIIEVFNIKVNTLLELYNSFGQLKDTYILTTTKTEIVLNDSYKQGLYLYKVKEKNKIVKTGKLVIEK